MKITNIESFRLRIPLLDRPRPEPWTEMLLVLRGYDDLERHPYGDKTIVHDGEISVPMHPGLGFDPEEDFLMEYSVN
jgi:hypothetical protein